MWEQIEERARKNAEYMIETGATVRACAKHFGMSKSTVHTVVTY
ncbi:MAG: sporulation transcriptional regulator SpoIIID [Bacilli bacterium]|nr:sporulation transcriptional regulator SpoIIID [Bacilli bacterium]